MVDQRARHFHVARLQAAAGRQLPNLRDDDAAAVSCGHGHGEHLALDGLAFHRQVAVLVGGSAPDDGHVDRESVVEQPFLAAERDHFDEVLGRHGVLLAARLARIDVGPEAYVRDQAGPSRGDLAHELRQDALGERVRLDLVRLDQCPEAWLVSDIAADRAPHEARQPELRKATVGEIPDADHADRGQVARPASFAEEGRQLVDEPLRERMPSARAADEQGAAVGHEPDRLSDVDHLAQGM